MFMMMCHDEQDNMLTVGYAGHVIKEGGNIRKGRYAVQVFTITVANHHRPFRDIDTAGYAAKGSAVVVTASVPYHMVQIACLKNTCSPAIA